SQLCGIRKNPHVGRISWDGDLCKKLSSTGVLGRIAGWLEIVVIWQQEPVEAVRPDRVSEKTIPHRISALARRGVVVLHRGDRVDATDTDNQTWHRVAKWLALLTIKEDERALGGKVIEYMVNYRRLSGAAKHPGARERRLLVRWQRARQLCVDGGLLTPQHPA